MNEKAEPESQAPDDGIEPFRILVGWTQAPFSRGVQLRLQSKRAEGPHAGAVEDHRFLMTRNQALLLANFLLDVTGQSLPPRRHEGPLRRALRRLTGG